MSETGVEPGTQNKEPNPPNPANMTSAFCWEGTWAKRQWHTYITPKPVVVGWGEGIHL